MSGLRGLLLAVLLCAALDVNLTRHERSHRPQDWLLPVQTLGAWGVFALLLAPLATFGARKSRAGLATALLVVAGPVVLHRVLASRVTLTSTIDVGEAAGPFLLALAVLLSCAWLLMRLEARLGAARLLWTGRLLAVVCALALVPRDGAWLKPPAPASPSAPPSREADPRPNLLLLVLDTTRADHLSPWGYERSTTPSLAELAAESTVFSRAYSASVFTLSSHVSMLTGQPPSLHGTTLRRQSVRAETVAQTLAAAGYRTGAFVGTAVLNAGRGLERGFQVYDDLVDPPVCETRLWALVNDAQVLAAKLIPALRFDGQPHWFQDLQRPASEVLARARDFVAAEDGRPWFVMINLFDPHWPYLPGEEARAAWVRPYSGPLDGHLFLGDDYPRGRVPDAADKAHVRDLYDAELWETDRAVSEFLAALEFRPGRTALVLTADHGEGLGERDVWSHEHLHAPQTHVPLLVHAPWALPPGRSDAPVSGVDVAPTLLELAGVPAGERLVVGRSLLQPPADERVLVVQDLDNKRPERDGAAALRGRFKLLRQGRPDGEVSISLHDLIADPLDEVDLSEQYPEVRAELLAVLEALAASNDDGDGTLENAQTLRALGYLGY
ncbi:MAG: sulfatase-like hydrolase/transferase [Planctomycetota bacterium]